MSAQAQPHIVRQRIFLALALLVLVALASLICINTAQGNAQIDDNTLGISDHQSIDPHALSQGASTGTEQKGISDKSSSPEGLRQAAERKITVKDPDPVLVLQAVDESNPRTKALAAGVGTTHPKPTAPHMKPNTSGAGWHKGMASAYDLDTNQGWDATASGVRLTPESVTVAVPESQSYLLGRAVEIVYGDKVVVATVTDTGGFEKYGRALDLAGGVWKAFGSPTWGDWGVRPVYYRFL